MRRRLTLREVALVALGLVCPLGLPALSPAAAELPDLSDSAVAARTWLRLKGDLAGSVTYEWVTGIAYGLPEGALAQPLFGMESVTVRQIRAAGDGAFVERNYACRLYKDPQTGAYIDGMLNPFTGRAVTLKATCNAGPPIRYSAERVELLTDVPFQSTALGGPMELQLMRAGDQVTIRRTAISTFTTAAGELRRELSIDRFTLPAIDLADASITSLRPAYSWDSVTRWMTVFDMAETPGRMLWSINGRNFMSPEELPPAFRAALERRVPGALAREIVWGDNHRP